MKSAEIKVHYSVIKIGLRRKKKLKKISKTGASTNHDRIPIQR